MLPDATGTYAVLLRCRSRRRIQVGGAGTLALAPGWYVYVGSARGPGGLRARVTHHLHRALRPHWHVDYLRRYTRVEQVWCAARDCEHEWAARVAAAPGATLPLRGFGSSDCGCVAHLVRFAERPDLGAALPDARMPL